MALVEALPGTSMVANSEGPLSGLAHSMALANTAATIVQSTSLRFI
jgi:hypothetical protein